MVRSRRFERGLVGLVVAALAIAVAFSSHSPTARAATGTDLGRHVFGTGSTTDGSGIVTRITVDVTVDAAGVASGSFSSERLPPGPFSTPNVATSGSVSCAYFVGASVALGIRNGSNPQLIAIHDNGATGDELWIDTDNTYGGDCTAGPEAGVGTVLSSGDYTIEGAPASSTSPSSSASPSGDANLDGIDDGLQGGQPANAFVDATTTPATSGSIVARNGLQVTVVDAPAPDGVQVTVAPVALPSGASAPQAELSLCGFTVFVDAGSGLVGTCHSVVVHVVQGRVAVQLGSSLGSVSIPSGGTAEVANTGGGSFTVANVGGSGSPAIALTVDGVTRPIAPNTTVPARAWDFVGFDQPIDNPPKLNAANAGQSIPIKWRLLDAAGAPVTNLVTATLTVTTLACPAGVTADQVGETTTGGTGLKNLGNGYYQLTWKAPKEYARSCKTLHLNLGDGVTHDVLFQFNK
jgi:hypothetical protein